MADNNTAYVSAAKGVKGGYFFSAPATDDALAAVYGEEIEDFTKKITEIVPESVNLGYISEDGWKINEDRDVQKDKDVNGEVVNSSTTSREETVAATLIEKSETTLKEMYGEQNVVSGESTIRAYHTGDDAPIRIYIADLVLKNGRRARYIMPKGQLTEIGEETVAANSLLGREITLTGNSFNDGNGHSGTMIEVLQKVEEPSTSNPGANQDQNEG